MINGEEEMFKNIYSRLMKELLEESLPQEAISCSDNKSIGPKFNQINSHCNIVAGECRWR